MKNGARLVRLAAVSALLAVAYPAMATTIYVDDTWGAAPGTDATGIASTNPNTAATAFPRENVVEDRLGWTLNDVRIVSYSKAGSVVTINTATPHGLVSGTVDVTLTPQDARISGDTGSFSFAITSVPTTTSFTYTNATLPATIPTTTNGGRVRLSTITGAFATPANITFSPDLINDNTIPTGAGAQVDTNSDGVTDRYEQKTYFPAPGGYLNLAIGAPATAVVDGVTVNLTVGTDAFRSMKEAFAFMGQAGASGVTEIKVMPGTYYESVIVPRNNWQAGIYDVARTTTTATITTSAPHGISGAGNVVTITGLPAVGTTGVASSLNGTWTLASASASTMTFSTSPTTGTIAYAENSADKNAIPGALLQFTVPTGTHGYYSSVAPYTTTWAGFNGEFASNFKITGVIDESAPVGQRRPIFTRGIVLDAETTSGFTIQNLELDGIPGVVTSGSASIGSGNYVVGGNNMIVKMNAPGNGAVADTLTAVDAGSRTNFSFINNIVDGQDVSVPFTAAQRRVGTSGGRGGVTFDGMLGNVTIRGNNFRGLRNFNVIDFDMNNASSGSPSSPRWSTVTAESNSIEDCWGNFSVRGRQVDTSGAFPTFSAIGPYRLQTAIIRGNSVRDMGRNAFDQRINAGGAFKVHNVSELQFINNAVTRVNELQNWFSIATYALGGLRNIPMGAGLLIRDRRVMVSTTASTGDGPFTIPGSWTKVVVRGNLFENTQQGIGIDGGGSSTQSRPFVPAGFGLADGDIAYNTFINNRTAVYFFDSLISYQPASSGQEIAMATFKNNILVESTDSPYGPPPTSLTPETPAQVAAKLKGAVVFDQVARNARAPYSSDAAHPFVFGPNFWQSGDGPAVVVEGSGTTGGSGEAIKIATLSSPVTLPTGQTQITTANFTGEEPGEFEDVYPNLDRDGDGLNDGVEYGDGTPVVGGYPTFPDNADSDGDGLSDGTEVRLGSDPRNAASPASSLADNTDLDNDNLPASLELQLGLNPNDADTDNDRIRDDYELLVGTNANDRTSYPLFGDANGDALLDGVDAVAVIEAFLDLGTLNGTNQNNVDVNRDGAVNNIDAIILFNLQVGNVQYIPFP